MKKLIVSFLIVLTSLSQANTQVGAALEIVGGTAVKDIVTHIANELRSVINEMDYSYSKNAFETKQIIEILIGNMENSASKILDKTFDQLTELEQKFFRDTNSTLNNILLVQDQTVENTRKVMNQFSSTLSVLPFANRDPKISNFEPKYILANKDLKNAKINISGSLLDYKTPTLNIDGKECELIGETTNNLTFNCDCSSVKDGNEYKDLIGELKIFKKEKYWIFFWKTVESTYKVSLQNIPEKMADIEIIAYTKKSNTKKFKRKAKYKEWNSHCCCKRPGRKITKTISRTSNEFKIDPNSISIVKRKKGRESYYNLNGKSESSFQVIGNLVNYGGCFAFAKDARGHLELDINYVETKTTINSDKIPVGTETINWNKGRPISLPKNTTGFSVVVNQMNGSTIALSEENMLNNNSWFNIDFDKSKGLLMINPKRLTDALN